MFGLDVQVGWAMSILANLCVYLIFIIRRHHKDLPAFNLYLLSMLAVSTVRFSTSLLASRGTYFWAFWDTQCVLSIVFLWLVANIVSSQLLPFSFRRPYLLLPAGALFVGSCVATALLVVLMHSLGLNVNAHFRLTNSFTMAQQATVGVAFVMLGCSAICSALLSIGWDRRVVWVAVGLLAECGIDAILFRILGGLGTLASHNATLAARLIALCIWLYVFAEKRPEIQQIPPREREEIRRLLKKVGGGESLNKKGERNEQETQGNGVPSNRTYASAL